MSNSIFWLATTKGCSDDGHVACLPIPPSLRYLTTTRNWSEIRRYVLYWTYSSSHLTAVHRRNRAGVFCDLIQQIIFPKWGCDFLGLSHYITLLNDDDFHDLYNFERIHPHFTLYLDACHRTITGTRKNWLLWRHPWIYLLFCVMYQPVSCVSPNALF